MTQTLSHVSQALKTASAANWSARLPWLLHALTPSVAPEAAHWNTHEAMREQPGRAVQFS